MVPVVLGVFGVGVAQPLPIMLLWLPSEVLPIRICTKLTTLLVICTKLITQWCMLLLGQA